MIDAARRSLNSIAGADRLYLANDLSGGSVLEFLAANLVDALRPIAANGLHKEYVRRSESTSHPRGRIDVAGTMRGWSRGQFHKVQAQRFEQSSDVPANRLLKEALGLCSSASDLTLRRASVSWCGGMRHTSIFRR